MADNCAIAPQLSEAEGKTNTLERLERPLRKEGRRVTCADKARKRQVMETKPELRLPLTEDRRSSRHQSAVVVVVVTACDVPEAPGCHCRSFPVWEPQNA